MSNLPKIRTQKEITVGPDTDALQIKNSEGVVVSYIDETGTLQGKMSSAGINNSNQLVIPSGGVVFTDNSIQTTAFVSPAVPTFPRAGTSFYVLGQTTGLGNVVSGGDNGGFVITTNTVSSNPLNSSTTFRSGATVYTFDLPVNNFYANFSNGVSAPNSVSLNTSSVGFHFGLRYPFYMETKAAFNIGTAGTGRIFLGFNDNPSGIGNAATGIPTALASNFVGFRFVSGGSGTKDTNWQLVAWNAANKSPGTVVDTGVVPDLTHPHVYTLTGDGTTITAHIDNVAVASILISDSNMPLLTVTGMSSYWYIDNNGTANSDVNNPNMLTVKYVYIDSTIPTVI